MRCETISEYLSAYVENDLEPGLRLNVDQHIESCETCRADLAAVADLFRVLDEPVLLVESPGSLADDVMRRLRVEQKASRKTAGGWFASLSRGWQFATAGAGVVAVLAVVLALGPFHEGVTGGIGGRIPWKTPAPAVSTPPTVSVVGSLAGFRAAGTPDDLLLDVSVPRTGHWRMTVRSSADVTVTAGGSPEPDGSVSVWQGDLAAGDKQRVSVRLLPNGQAAVHEVTLRLVGPSFADAAAVSVMLPAQMAPSTSSPLQWRTSQATTLRQALAALAAYRATPISAPSGALDQPVTVNASGINAEDVLDAVAAAASLKVDRSDSACNLHR
ncbi:MAG TPA: zf-HC2 domain-containing protein [Armatimonadota bacterium]|jgi:hypothetical protein